MKNNYVKGNRVMYHGDLYIVESVSYHTMRLGIRLAADPKILTNCPINEVDPYPLHIRTRYMHFEESDHAQFEHFVDSPIQPMVGYTVRIDGNLYKVIDVCIDTDKKSDEDKHFTAYIEFVSA